MRVAVVAPPAIRVPVEGYGGIEKAAWDLAVALVRRGHDVTVFGNVAGEMPMSHFTNEFGETAVPATRRILTENDALTHLDELSAFDAVSDWTHTKPLRLARLRGYIATAMWTDSNAPGRTVYPSGAVRNAFKEPDAPVIPLGLPVDTYGPLLPPTDEFLCFGRVAPYKGQDLAVGLAEAHGKRLAVAGHVGAFGDVVYAMRVEKRCRDGGHRYLPNVPPGDVGPLIGSAAGLLHPHRWLESFSLVAAEALCRGVPVLTTDQGAPSELVLSTGGGKVTPLKALDEGRFDTPSVRAFFDTDWAPRREEFSRKAREQFDVARVAALYERLYEGAA